MIQFNFLDSYENVTIDTLYGLKYALDWRRYSMDPPDFLMLADDDSFINIPALWKRFFPKHFVSFNSVSYDRAPLNVGLIL